MNNDPAFPTNESRDMSVTPGMTLRDYFAAKAMQGLMDAAMPADEVAENAYIMADAMITARGL